MNKYHYKTTSWVNQRHLTRIHYNRKAFFLCNETCKKRRLFGFLWDPSKRHNDVQRRSLFAVSSLPFADVPNDVVNVDDHRSSLRTLPPGRHLCLLVQGINIWVQVEARARLSRASLLRASLVRVTSLKSSLSKSKFKQEQVLARASLSKSKFKQEQVYAIASFVSASLARASFVRLSSVKSSLARASLRRVSLVRAS